MSWIPEQIAVRKPAPAAIRSFLIGTVKPDGRPLRAGSCESEKGVLAMQMGKRPNPS